MMRHHFSSTQGHPVFQTCMAIMGSSPFGTSNVAVPSPLTITVALHVPPVLPHGGRLLSQEMTSQYSPPGSPVCRVCVMAKSSLLMKMNALFPLPKAIAWNPLSHQLDTGLPIATLWNRTMLYICLQRCSHIHSPLKHSTSFVVPPPFVGGPIQLFVSWPLTMLRGQ